MLTTAHWLGEMLGEEILLDKMNCRWVVSKSPADKTVTERAIPSLIFSTDFEICSKCLCWTQTNKIKLREILDWAYYRDRLVATLQQMVTLPAFMQGVSNPVPRVRTP